MPAYTVVVAVGKQKKVVKTMQPSSSDAEREAKNQFPGAEIISVGRAGEDAIRSSPGRWKPNDH